MDYVLDTVGLKSAQGDQREVIRLLEPLVRRSKWTDTKEIYELLIKLNRVLNFLCTEDTRKQIAEAKERRSEAQKAARREKAEASIEDSGVEAF